MLIMAAFLCPRFDKIAVADATVVISFSLTPSFAMPSRRPGMSSGRTARARYVEGMQNRGV